MVFFVNILGSLKNFIKQPNSYFFLQTDFWIVHNNIHFSSFSFSNKILIFFMCLYELCKLYELYELYEFFMNHLKSPEIA